jgi:hypothetical protein
MQSGHSQDILFFLDGREMKVTIEDITETEVAYKPFRVLQAATEVVHRSKLFAATMANGDVISLQIAPEIVRPAPVTQAESPEQVAPSAEPATEPTAAAFIKPLPQDNLATKRDRWGRTYDQNMKLAKKRKVAGAVMLPIGGSFIIVGAALLIGGVATSSDSYYSSNGYRESYTNTAQIVPGAILLAAGLPLTLIGAAKLGTSKKYRKRAQGLMQGISLAPSIQRMDRFEGSLAKADASYGLRLSYSF